MSSSSGASRKLFMVVALAMNLLPVAHADPAPAVVRIGLMIPLVAISPEEGLRQGLAELGYVEGRNLIIERRRAESSKALRTAAEDLVRSKVNLIIALSTPAAHAALSATATIPLVFSIGRSGSYRARAKSGAPGTQCHRISVDVY